MRRLPRRLFYCILAACSIVTIVGHFVPIISVTSFIKFIYEQLFRYTSSGKTLAEHPYFVLPRRSTSDGVLVPDWVNLFDGATECFSQCDSLRLFIIVCSALGNAEKRAAIRETWANGYLSLATKSNNTALVRFFVGQINDEHRAKQIQNEAAQFGDLVILRDTGDEYPALVKKVLRSFQYLLRCLNGGEANDGERVQRGGEFSCHDRLLVVKTDDDNYVNVGKLIQFATKYNFRSPPTIHGSLLQNVHVRRQLTDKWYVPIETYPHEMYPDYVSGSLYIAPLTVIRTLVHLAMHFSATSSILSWEDIFFTGLLPQLVDPPIRRESLSGVNWQRIDRIDACDYLQAYNFHYLTPDELRGLWRRSLSCR